jgi:hypothetical protein
MLVYFLLSDNYLKRKLNTFVHLSILMNEVSAVCLIFLCCSRLLHFICTILQVMCTENVKEKYLQYA